MDNQRHFLLIRSACVECVSQPSVEAFRRLRQALEGSDGQLIKPIVNYLLVPIQNILHQYATLQTDREAILLEACLSLQLVLAKCDDLNLGFDYFADFYVRLFCMCDARVSLDTQPRASEDLRARAIETADSLLRHSTTDVFKAAISSEQFRRLIGHSVSVLLDMATNEQGRSLRTLAMATLRRLLSRFEQLCGNGDEFDLVVRDVFAAFLPGISISVLKIMTSDHKHPLKLVVLALHCLQAICCLCLTNLSTGPIIAPDGPLTSPPPATTTPAAPPRPPTADGHQVLRDSGWAIETSQKLKTAFKTFFPVVIKHQSLEVRRALVQCCARLCNCSREFVAHNIEVLSEPALIFLSEPTLRTEAERLLQVLSNLASPENDDDKLLGQVLLDKCYRTLMQLPREIRTLDDPDKLARLNLLSGIFTMLGVSGINSLLRLPEHRQRLLECLVDVAELDTKHCCSGPLPLLPDQLPHDGRVRVPKKFSHFESSSDEAERHLVDCCNSLAGLAEPEMLVDLLKDNLLISPRAASAIFISNCLLLNLNQRGGPRPPHPSALLGEYLRAAQEIEPVNSEAVMKLALLIEGMVVVVDSSQTEDQLTELLYFILKHANTSSSNLFLSELSKLAIEAIAQRLNFPTTNALLRENIPALAHKIEIKLKLYAHNTEAVLILNSLLNLGGFDLLAQLEAVVDEALVALDECYQSDLIPLLMLLHSSIHASLKLSNENKKTQLPNEKPAAFGNEVENFKTKLHQFLADRTISQSFGNEQQPPDDDGNQLEDEQQEATIASDKPALPSYALMTKKILERCVHLLSAEQSQARAIVLDMSSTGMLVMRPYQDDLLPLAHKLWDPLVKRFQDEVALMRKAFKALLTLSELCGDFLRHRVQSHVLPRLMQFLRRQANESKNCRHGYRFTTNYELQLDALNGIGLLAYRLTIEGKNLWSLIMTVMPYLSARQPRPLQEAAENSLHHFQLVEPDTVWLYATLYIDKNSTTARQEMRRLERFL